MWKKIQTKIIFLTIKYKIEEANNNIFQIKLIFIGK